MKNREIVVRIIHPSTKPALPKGKITAELEIPEEKNIFRSRFINILTGSSLGSLAGLLIYLMLRGSGLHLDGLESTFIIGLPALLGIATSYAIF